jgi:hypothetical protein
MLNASVMMFDGSGRIRNTTAPPANFNGGTPTVQRLLSGDVVAPTAVLAGLAYGPGGQLCTTAALPAAWQGSIPTSATGQVCVTTAGTVTHWGNGLPRVADGRLALAPAETPVVTNGFDNGFDQGYG